MAIDLNTILISQFEASLSMLKESIEKCPAEHWDGIIGKYPFWHVAYHTLCFVDVYLCPRDEDWMPRTGENGLHPLGRTELDEEYPSRRFSQTELLEYVEICHEMMKQKLGAETAATLEGPSGFSWLPFSRAELHIYNLRHIHDHTGQLTAYLRRAGVDTKWVKAGWKQAGYE